MRQRNGTPGGSRRPIGARGAAPDDVHRLGRPRRADLADSLRAVAQGHDGEAGVFHVCRMLAEWSDWLNTRMKSAAPLALIVDP